MRFTLLKDWNGFKKGEAIEVGLAFIDLLRANGYIGDALEKKVPDAATEKKSPKRNV